MKRKRDSSESEKDGTIDIQENSTNSLQNNRFEFTESKTKKKLPHIFNRQSAEQGKISTFSSASKINSYLRGNSVTQVDHFKPNDSAFFNQLAEKYVSRGASRQKMREEMTLALQRKTSQIQALRVHRDQLKFISYNNPYDIPIKISLAVLKQKAKMQEKIKDYKLMLKKDIKDLDTEFNMMTDYYNFVTNALKAKGEEDLIIDTQQQELLMIQNLQKENNLLFRELKEEDKRNAKEIRNIQQDISLLRVYIKQKEDKIRDLKSKICFLHIKLHSRSSNSKQKSMSMSIRKFNNEQNNTVQQAFIGNNSFKSFSKEIIEKVTNEHELVKIKFYYDKRRELLTFQCLYRKWEGRMHDYQEDIYEIKNNQLQSKDKKIVGTEIRAKYLLSFKFYFKSKIVGVECRLKSQKGTENVQIGNCSSNLEHELLTLVNKRILTLSSYWHQKDMIGIGIWYCLREERLDKSDKGQQQKKPMLKTVQSAKNLNADYYN